MSQETILFYSKMEHPKIVMETKKRFKDDGEATGGKVIQFDRHHYSTSDEEVIEFMRKHPLYGHEYVEVAERKQEPAPVGKPTVASMGEDEKLANMEKRILSTVDSKLDAIVDKISSIVAPQSDKKAAKSDDTAKDDASTDDDKKSKKGKKKDDK